MDFAIAICEYVFVLAQKYTVFKERQAVRAKKKAAVAQATKDGKGPIGRVITGGGVSPVTKPEDEEHDDIPF